MNKNISNTLIAVVVALSLSSCKKDKTPDTPAPATKPGTVQLNFVNVVGSSMLKMDGTWYRNQSGDSFTVTKFNYYISNIQLIRADGSVYAEPESYHLIEQSDSSSQHFSISNIPAGTYRNISFMIGVDSLRNVSGAQSGALDPAKGMFWSWSTGYIMLKLEGTSPQSTQPGNNYQLHGGGFKGGNNVLRTVNFELGLVVNGTSDRLDLTADVQKVLGNPNPIQFANTSVIMSAGATAKAFADNYQNMFTLHRAIE